MTLRERALLATAAALVVVQVTLASPSDATQISSRTLPQGAIGPISWGSPDFKHSKAVRTFFFPGDGTLVPHSLNGISADFTYNDTAQFGTHVTLITWFQTYGNPPPPSNGGILVDWYYMNIGVQPMTLGTAQQNSSILYKKLRPSATYSIDVFENLGSGFGHLFGFPQSIGSPTSGGSLSFASPFNGLRASGLCQPSFPACSDFRLIFELVQNP
jgi:hypothetical protein